MPLLHASVSEALRLRPPLIFLMRTAMTDLQIKVICLDALALDDAGDVDEHK